jgi:uncharacterized membrane protein
MKNFGAYIAKTLMAGLLVVAPVYLAILLLLKAMGLFLELIGPMAKVLPESLAAREFIFLLLVLLICFIAGVIAQTPVGHAAWEQIEKTLFHKIPGYALLRSLTQRMAGETEDNAWKPALAEIEEALVPAFIIEELDDGRLTVFVPSVPTPFAGAIYILTPDRVHPIDVSFAQATKTVARWGSGSKNLVAAMDAKKNVVIPTL